MKKFIIFVMFCLVLNAMEREYLAGEVPVSARQAALGAGTAVLGDVNGLFYNPISHAGSGSYQVGFTHNEWIFDVNAESLFVSVPSRIGYSAALLKVMYAGDLDYYDASGTRDGVLKYNDLAVSLAHAVKLGTSIYLGGAIDLVRENNGRESGLGTLFSIGSLFSINDNISLGLSFKDLGPGPKMIDAYMKSPPIVRGGFAGRISASEKAIFNILFDTSYRFDRTVGLALGLESRLFKYVNLRGGVSLLDWAFSFNFGGGVELDIRGMRYALDYAYDPMKDFRPNHILQLSLALDPFTFNELAITEAEFDDIIPVVSPFYHEQPLGTINIINKKDFPLKNLEIEAVLPDYADADFKNDVIAEFPPGTNIQIDVYIKPGGKMADLEKDKKVPVKITARYDYGGKPKEVRHSQTITIFGKNTIDWSDDNMIGAFVTPHDKVLKKFSSGVISDFKDDKFPGVNENIRKAVILFDALGKFGMTYVRDPNSAWNRQRRQAMKVDTIQFPSESMKLKTGDCDDLATLYSAMLEGVGIATAFVYTPGHVFIMFDTEVSERQSQDISPRDDLVIIAEGRVWVPVEITMAGQPFYEAWQTGAAEYNRGNAEFVIVGNAWEVYQPVEMDIDSDKVRSPDRGDYLEMVKKDMADITTLKLSQLDTLLAQAEKEGTNALLWNQVGLSYARSGIYDKAKDMFEKASKLAPKNCLIKNNLANINYIEKELKMAIKGYQKCIEICGDDPKYYMNLAKAYLDSGQVKKAVKNYQVAVSIQPGYKEKSFDILVEQYKNGELKDVATMEQDKDATLVWSIRSEVKNPKQYPVVFKEDDKRYKKYKGLKTQVNSHYDAGEYWDAFFTLARIFTLSPYNQDAREMMVNIYPRLTEIEKQNVEIFLKRVIEHNKDKDPERATGYRELLAYVQSLAE